MSIKPKKLINNTGYEKTTLVINKFYNVKIEFETAHIDDIPIAVPFFIIQNKKHSYKLSISRFDLKAVEEKKEKKK